MSILKKLAGQTAIYGLSSILGRLLNTALTPYYTKLFAEGEFGQISDLYSWITFANVILTFGMETAFFRYSREWKNPEKAYNQSFLFVSALSVIFLLFSSLAYLPLSKGLGYENAPQLVLMAIIVIALDTLTALPMAKLRQSEKAKHFAAINLTNIGLTLGCNIFFLSYLHKGIEYVFVSNIIASSVRLLMSMLNGFPTEWKIDQDLIRQMTKYSIFIMVAGFAGMMNENLDKILIGRLWEDGNVYHGHARSGQEMQGLYSAGYKLGIFISLVTQAFRYAVEPFFFRHSEEQNSPQTFAQIFHYFMIACLACFLLISSFEHELVSIKIYHFTFINQRYWESLEIVPIILLAYVFSAAYIQISAWFKITGQTKFALLFTGIGAIITILINVLTIPKYGYMGSAWATLVCYVVMTVMVYFYGQKHYPVPYRMGRFVLYLSICVLGYFICDKIGFELGTINWELFGLKLGVCGIILGGIAAWEKYERSKMLHKVKQKS